MESSEYWLPRLLLQRGLALMYLMGFLAAVNQFRPLCGQHGLLPAPGFMQLIPFRAAPSIFYLFPHDRAFQVCAWLGALLSVAAMTGVSEDYGILTSVLVWFLLWVLYLSYVNVGQEFYAFGWESLLLECGFLAIFLGPAHMEPAAAIIWLYRWVLFRVMFGAGLIKMRGDPCWRDLSCLNYHFETQPMPNPASRFFHFLPAGVRRCGVLFNHVAELGMPLLYFAPQPVAAAAGAVSALFLLSIMVSGNFAWLNWLTFILCCSTVTTSQFLTIALPPLTPAPPLYQAACWGVVILVAIRSWQPSLNMISPGQIMNTSFDPFQLVNTYGAFGSITRDRFEIVVEGTDDATPGTESGWQEYEFRGKPGNPQRIPPFIAPYHLRLDWLMWFAAMPSRSRPLWFIHFMARLLQGDRQVLALLKHNPFPDQPPQQLRALYYRYRFATGEELRQTGNRWVRDLIGPYVPAVSLTSPSFRRILQAYRLE